MLNQFNELNIDEDIKNCTRILKQYGAARKRSYIYRDFIQPGLSIDLVHYRKLLKIFKQTRVKNARWRINTIQSILEIDINDGQGTYVIKLNQ